MLLAVVNVFSDVCCYYYYHHHPHHSDLDYFIIAALIFIIIIIFDKNLSMDFLCVNLWMMQGFKFQPLPLTQGF
jgi:hypothetical protein